MNKIIRRILKYNKLGRSSFDVHEPIGTELSDYIMISCMDKRLIPNDFLKVPIGHVFVVRNAGNFVPSHEHHNCEEISTEGGAIELAVKKAGIKNIIISGHSDCKAMLHLSNIHQPEADEYNSPGPLSEWVRKFGKESWNKYQKYLRNRNHPIQFQLKPPPSQPVNAYIDENLSVLDCLSQINCLQQTENIARFPFLREDLLENQTRIHTLWAELSSNINDTNMFMFIAEEERFLKITDEFADKLIKDSGE